ncbi:MAG: hypothetical protein CM1200mP11_4360 [Nitrosopumilaceae archaeon]|nr:MAG: hypothetical protein CM1200mP11_4360 [Nitrosopumilaceae archaeon]
MGADNKPNNKPYKKGAHYTGKGHSWDEAFGYFGAPASYGSSASRPMELPRKKILKLLMQMEMAGRPLY